MEEESGHREMLITGFFYVETRIYSVLMRIFLYDHEFIKKDHCRITTLPIEFIGSDSIDFDQRYARKDIEGAMMQFSSSQNN